jgi:hypothetical protein
MLYAERDDKGIITAISNHPSTPDQEQVTEAELIQFFSESGDSGSYETLLSLLDTRVIRVLDDLIDLLVKKNVIMFTELPDEARQKIGERKKIRRRLQDNNQLMVDDIL